MKKLLFLFLPLLLLSSCVGKKKYTKMLDQWDECKLAQENINRQYEDCKKEKIDLNNQLLVKENALRAKDNELALMKEQVDAAEKQLEYFKANNANLLTLMSDLSVVNKAGAENIKSTLDQLNERNQYIKDLTAANQRKDSLNLILAMNLKRSLADINDQDVTVEVRKGVVYISISDKMLFKSGSSEISPSAEGVLSKIAKVVNDHKDIEILVEGHTDNVPITNACVADNWDLSVKRATSVVRALQTKYGVKPGRMTAGGRGEYAPKVSNDTADGRKLNRRTEIIILPLLDQFMQLLEEPKKK